MVDGVTVYIAGNSFSGNFESHCRQVIRYLWHCCGHLYSKHWEQLTMLNLRPQCGLVLAHLHMIAKLYGLLDSKDLTSLSHTTQVRIIFVGLLELCLAH